MQTHSRGDIVDAERSSCGAQDVEHSSPARTHDGNVRHVRSQQLMTRHTSIFAHDVGETRKLRTGWPAKQMRFQRCHNREGRAFAGRRNCYNEFI
jgi:hypothetical protein